MADRIDLFLAGGTTPVCRAHLETYIDEPAWIAEPSDYDAWRLSHGEEMSCARCRGVHGDAGGDQMGPYLPAEDSHEGASRGGMARASGDEIARQFASYLRHPSVIE